MVNYILIEDEILKALNNKNINFSIDKILNNEFLVLSCNNYKLIITLYYLKLLEVA